MPRHAAGTTIGREPVGLGSVHDCLHRVWPVNRAKILASAGLEGACGVILLDLVLVGIGIWEWMCRNKDNAGRYGVYCGWWQYLDIVGFAMAWHHGWPAHPEYE